MSSNYEFSLALTLNNNVPDPVIGVLQSLIDRRLQNGLVLPEHEFFRRPNWEQTFTAYSTMTPFAGISFVRLDFVQELRTYDFSVRTIGKGEQLYEAMRFIQWILQYSTSTGFIGYYRGEDEFAPVLFASRNKKLMISTGEISFANLE